MHLSRYYYVYQQLFDDARLPGAQIRRVGIVVAAVVSVGENIVGEGAVSTAVEHVIRIKRECADWETRICMCRT